MKTKFLGLLGGAFMAMTPTLAAAQDSAMPGTFTGNVAIVSDYVFRGVTQSTQDPARGTGMVVLHKCDIRTHCLREDARIPRFQKKTPIVRVDLGPNHQ